MVKIRRKIHVETVAEIELGETYYFWDYETEQQREGKREREKS
jgi:hypothetical protein